jgi:integrase
MSRKRANGEGCIYAYRNGFAAYAWVTTPEGLRQRKFVYGKTREIVHEKWIKLQEQAKRRPVPTTMPTVRQYFADWQRDVVTPGLAPATAANYEMFTRLYVAPALGHRRLDKLTVREVQTWLTKIKTTCQCCVQGKDAARPVAKQKCCAKGRCCHQVPSEWTAHQAWTVLRSGLSNAVRDELISRNVAALVRVPVPRPRKPRPWTVDEARRFLESARSAEDPYYVAYVLILTLGLRRGEVLGLAWNDVDLDAGELHVAWQLQRVQGELLRRQTKTASSEAPLPVPYLCDVALKEQCKRQGEWRQKAGPAWHDTDLVVTTRYGQPVDPRNFHRAFVARCHAAKVPVSTVHATRRTCASLLVALDVHPRVAMQILRHSQIAVTMNIYSEVSSRETREALRRLGLELTEEACR